MIAPPVAVSIIIPMRNAAARVARTLGSVLAQSFRDFEIIIGDDASTDGSAKAAEDLLRANAFERFTILPLHGRGAAASRNAAIRAARGEYIAFLDDDDWWTPDKLERCMARMRTDTDMLCHAEWWEREDGARAVHIYSEMFDSTQHPLVSVMRNNPFSTSAVVIKRQLLLDAGLFDETLPSAEDFDLWLRCVMQPHIRIGFIDTPLGTYLLRAGSESAAVTRRRAAMMAIGAKYASALREVSNGSKEYWIYRAKVRFTTGLRFLGQGQWAPGIFDAATGFLMWPFRIDWVMFALRGRLRQAKQPAARQQEQ